MSGVLDRGPNTYLFSKSWCVNRNVLSGKMDPKNSHTESVKLLLVPEVLAVDDPSFKHLHPRYVWSICISVMSSKRFVKWYSNSFRQKHYRLFLFFLSFKFSSREQESSIIATKNRTGLPIAQRYKYTCLPIAHKYGIKHLWIYLWEVIQRRVCHKPFHVAILLALFKWFHIANVGIRL
jgi:hypothetical protein